MTVLFLCRNEQVFEMTWSDTSLGDNHFLVLFGFTCVVIINYSPIGDDCDVLAVRGISPVTDTCGRHGDVNYDNYWWETWDRNVGLQWWENWKVFDPLHVPREKIYSKNITLLLPHQLWNWKIQMVYKTGAFRGTGKQTWYWEHPRTFF